MSDEQPAKEIDLLHVGVRKYISTGLYRSVSLSLSILFAVVGLVFLLAPEAVQLLFNSVSRHSGMQEAPLQDLGFFLILAVGYMYLVALLAYLMFLHPENRYFPWILIHGKTASSVLSFWLFILHGAYLIYLTNGIVDGAIAAGVLMLSRKARKTPK
jgi:hypothetical protein